MSKIRVTLTPQQIQEKWANRLSGAVSDIQRGVDAVTENPMEKAALAADKWQQNIIASKQRYIKNISAVTLQTWKTQMKDKVAQRLAGGVQAAKAKRLAFDQANVATLNEILPEINAMPSMTLEDNIARASAFMRKMSSRKYKDRS